MPKTNSAPEPTLPGSESTITTTPTKPTASPSPRRNLTFSCRATRAIRTAKNGAELISTAVTAGPAVSAPMPRPVRARVVAPSPTMPA